MRADVLLPVLGLAFACTPDANNPIAGCTAPMSEAVVVVVNDSISGASVADGARGVAQAGAYVDSLQLFFPPPRLAGGKQLGTYMVIVDRPGYHEWVRTDVVVSQQGPCGNVIPVQLTALLQRTP
jgi:hypothetical protein